MDGEIHKSDISSPYQPTHLGDVTAPGSLLVHTGSYQRDGYGRSCLGLHQDPEVQSIVVVLLLMRMLLLLLLLLLLRDTRAAIVVAVGGGGCVVVVGDSANRQQTGAGILAHQTRGAVARGS